MDQRPNILIIMTDEHGPSFTGCYGHPVVETPNLDRLAQEGVVFDNAYCNSPLCCPSRMSFLTGRYCHQIGGWDNRSWLPFEVPTFANYFEAAGYDATLCGRMHIIGDDRLRGFGKRLYDDILGNPEGYDPVKNRQEEARRGSNSHATVCGPGESSWQEYDEVVRDLSTLFLETQAESPGNKPWLLVTGFMLPHFPLVAPPEYFDRYYPDNVILPDLRGETLESQHPVIQHLRWYEHDEKELPEEILRTALAGYYGLVSLADTNIGALLDIVDSSHLRENTTVVYTSDHGEMAGQHGMWQKMSFYESSVRVPLIVRQPGGKQGIRVGDNVSLVDVMPTILDMAGSRIPRDLPGQSLLSCLDGTPTADRAILSEYHGQGMVNGAFMIKRGDYKYNHYVGGYRPQLFNTAKDPGEFRDLSSDPDHSEVLAKLRDELLSILDPVQVDQQAKRNQRKVGKTRAFRGHSQSLLPNWTPQGGN